MGCLYLGSSWPALKFIFHLKFKSYQFFFFPGAFQLDHLIEEEAFRRGGQRKMPGFECDDMGRKNSLIRIKLPLFLALLTDKRLKTIKRK